MLVTYYDLLMMTHMLSEQVSRDILACISDGGRTRTAKENSLPFALADEQRKGCAESAL